MDVPLKKKSYIQKYRTEWENDEDFKQWIKPIADSPTKAFCKYCHVEIAAKIYDLRKHRESKKHKAKCELITKNKQIQFTSTPDDGSKNSQKAEGQLALFIAEHTSISNTDHLTDLCKEVFHDSKCAKDIKMHRTKCTQVINQVLAPHFKDTLLIDIGTQKYSIILDESTDVSVSKYMGIIIRYFSLNTNNIVSSFLSLEPIERADARGIVTSLVKCLESQSLPIQNLIGIGTDNASVMTGRNNSVIEILKREYNLPNLILIRCICHSLQLAVSHASESNLPRNIEFLIRETYNWFSISPKRRDEYKALFQTINCGDEPLKILKVCDTRWLSIEPAVLRILAQWNELKLHFSLAREKCYTAGLLWEMYNDEGNRLYLCFLKSILHDVQIGIKVFEGENIDPVKLLETLMTLLRSVCVRIIIPGAATTDKDFLTIKVEDHLDPVAHLGHLFEFHASNSNLSPQAISNIKKRCIDFSVKLVQEIQNRIPSNYEILAKVTLLSPENTLKQIKDPHALVGLARELGFDDQKTDKIVQQWKTIQFIEWETAGDSVKFWAQVLKYKNAAGVNTFRELADLAIAAMSLPHSNAEVERLFSVMNTVKNKLRNRMCSLTLNSIIMIRNQLKIKKKNCHNYVLPPEVLKKIKKTVKPLKQIVTPSTSSSPIDEEVIELPDDIADLQIDY
ncbi:unnamed protein product [Parnassius apollo]|uniref:(apollo) hypothetical protein n=1 Tax=Parnassius apollo TaxID=110799 RepID=A0A8S3WHT8_PARAO|nr:unnamed protein product [Parnassius apollo]